MAQFKQPVIEDVEDADYRAYFNSSVFRVWHLDGKQRTYKILQVKRLDSEFKGEERKQPLLFLADRDGVVPLPLALNKTNAKTIAGLYGTRPSQWVGKFVTLFPTTTDVGGKQEACIRVRNSDPTARREAVNKSRAERANKQGVNVIKDREPGDDSEEESALLPGDEDEPPFGALETDNAIQ